MRQSRGVCWFFLPVSFPISSNVGPLKPGVLALRPISDKFEELFFFFLFNPFRTFLVNVLEPFIDFSYQYRLLNQHLIVRLRGFFDLAPCALTERNARIPSRHRGPLGPAVRHPWFIHRTEFLIKLKMGSLPSKDLPRST